MVYLDRFKLILSIEVNFFNHNYLNKIRRIKGLLIKLLSNKGKSHNMLISTMIRMYFIINLIDINSINSNKLTRLLP